MDYKGGDIFGFDDFCNWGGLKMEYKCGRDRDNFNENWERIGKRKDADRDFGEERGSRKKKKREVKIKDFSLLGRAISGELSGESEVLIVERDGEQSENESKQTKEEGQVREVNDSENEVDETEKKRERIEYLAKNLVEDLRTVYGSKEVDKREAHQRLDIMEVGILTKRDEKNQVRKEWGLGKSVADVLNNYMEMSGGYPKGWRQVEANLKRMNLTEEDLKEARKWRKENVINKTDNIDEVKKTEVQEESIWKKLGEKANLEKLSVLKKVVDGLEDEVKKTNQEMIMRAAYTCLMDVDKRKQSEGRWKSLYRPLLVSLDIKISD